MVNKYFKAAEIKAFLKKNKYDQYLKPIDRFDTAITVNDIKVPYLLIEKESKKKLIKIIPLNDVIDLTVCDSEHANQTILTLLCYCLLNDLKSIALFGLIHVQFEVDSPQSTIPKEVFFYPQSAKSRRPDIEDILDLLRESKFSDETKCTVIGFKPPQRQPSPLRNCNAYELEELKSILHVI